MYLAYETYASYGGQLSEAEFEQREAWAEMHLDKWTLNRLQSVDWSAWQQKVERCMFELVQSYEAVTSEEGGAPISHFSNGQDSFTFAEPLMNTALHRVYGFCVDLLPVELMSACVSYNGAS